MLLKGLKAAVLLVSMANGVAIRDGPNACSGPGCAANSEPPQHGHPKRRKNKNTATQTTTQTETAAGYLTRLWTGSHKVNAKLFGGIGLFFAAWFIAGGVFFWMKGGTETASVPKWKAFLHSMGFGFFAGDLMVTDGDKGKKFKP